MSKHNIAVGLLVAGGALFIFDFVAGLQSANGQMPSWYPDSLASVQSALPLSLEYIMLISGGVLLYV